MVLAADYPFLNIFWTMILFFAWGVWFFMMIVILTDVFRRHDISGWTKTAWVLFMLVLPFVGTFVYLIRNGGDLTARRDPRAGVNRADFSDYAGTVAADGGSAGEIQKAKALLDSGAITQSEFEQLKTKALA